jgi:hypothetical protein
MAKNVEYRNQDSEYRVKKNGKWGEWKIVSFTDDSDLFFHFQNKVISEVTMLSLISETYVPCCNNLRNNIEKRHKGDTSKECDEEIEKWNKKITDFENCWKTILSIEPNDNFMSISDQINTYYNTNNGLGKNWYFIEKYILARLLKKRISSKCPFLDRLKDEFPRTYNAINYGMQHEIVKVKGYFLDFNDAVNSICWMFRSTRCTISEKEIYRNILCNGTPPDGDTFHNGYSAKNEPKKWEKSRNNYGL